MHFRSLVGLWASSSLAHVALASLNITIPDTELGVSPATVLFANSLLQRPDGSPPLFNRTRLRLDVPVITTTAELDAFQHEYGNLTRIEEVDGQAIVIYHNNNDDDGGDGDGDISHIATVEGQALENLQRSCDDDAHEDEDDDDDDDGSEDGEDRKDGNEGGKKGHRLGKRTRCSNHWCLTRTNCSMNRCTQCVVLWCV